MTTAEAPLDRRSRWRRIQAPVVLAGGVLAVSVALHVRDPHQSGSWGLCPWLLLTGTYCPGCGGLRAVSDLTHGQVGAAASSNLLLVTSIPPVAWWWCRSVLRRWRGAVLPVDGRWVVVGAAVFGVLALTFGVLRNTGPGSWLAP